METLFLDAQGQLTPWSKVVSARIPNLSKLLCMSSLSARMRNIQLKIKTLVVITLYIDFKTPKGS